MNTILRVKLTSIDDIKEFAKAANKLKCEVVVNSGRYVIDGKSIMGLFSLDLSKTLEVNFIGEHNSDDIDMFSQWVTAA